MSELKCKVCGGNDGMEMYGAVICKARLAQANAENDVLRRITKERDEARADVERLTRERDDWKQLAADRAENWTAEINEHDAFRVHAEKVLVAVTKEAAKVGAEDVISTLRSMVPQGLDMYWSDHDGAPVITATGKGDKEAFAAVDDLVCAVLSWKGAP